MPIGLVLKWRDRTREARSRAAWHEYLHDKTDTVPRPGSDKRSMLDHRLDEARKRNAGGD